MVCRDECADRSSLRAALKEARETKFCTCPRRFELGEAVWLSFEKVSSELAILWCCGVCKILWVLIAVALQSNIFQSLLWNLSIPQFA